MPRLRTVKPVLPSEVGSHRGLAYTLWIPEAARGGIVIVHGAGSCKESHHDFARAALPLGLAAIAFDQRGHGESDGPMDGRALDDVVAIADHLRASIGGGAPVALRGSSMGGCLALLAAPLVEPQAVVAICPASTEGLRRGLRSGRFGFDADAPALESLLAEQDLYETVESLEVPVLLMHAAGDEQVPVEHSRELAHALRSPVGSHRVYASPSCRPTSAGRTGFTVRDSLATSPIMA